MAGGGPLGGERRIDRHSRHRTTRATALPPRTCPIAPTCSSSGSTGTPKAVLGACRARALAALAAADVRDRSGDRCGQLTGLSFDVVLRDIFLPLTSGATLVIPSEGEDTLRWLEREEISAFHTVPSVMAAWLSNGAAAVSLPRLKRVFMAGEPLTASLVARWREICPNGEIVNLYGPTETTLAKCYYVVPARPRPGIQPLGRTLPQTQALVLTPDRARCGIGEPGEIAIRTPFRTRGYLHAPEENEKRFVVNPFRNDPSDLLYLTGDRGVYDADGLLEFRGRLDHQVKVRGVRVEPMKSRSYWGARRRVAPMRARRHRGLALVAYRAEEGTGGGCRTAARVPGGSPSGADGAVGVRLPRGLAAHRESQARSREVTSALARAAGRREPLRRAA